MNAAPPDSSSLLADHAGPRQAPLEGVTISSSKLLRGQPYVLIEHGGAVYWLRATRSGKLILTK